MNKFDHLYMDIAERVAQLSHAKRKQVGAVLVKDNNILSYGYNGTPAGMDNCCEVEAPIIDHGDEIITVTKREVIHAEVNAILKVAASTNSSYGSTLYLTLSPCIECAKLIIQAGVKKVYFSETYRDDSSIIFLQTNGVEVIQYER